MIISSVSSSRLPVGSSAMMIGELEARARAMATRCCWPPESRPTRRFPSSAVMPTLAKYLLGSSLRLMESQLRFNIFLNIFYLSFDCLYYAARGLKKA